MKQEPKIFPYIARLLQGAEVVWKPLGEVAELKRGQRVTKQELSNDKQYPVYSGGVKPMGYYDAYNQEANTITIVKYGTAGYVNFITERFWANDVCYCIKPHSILENKYLLYVLKNMQVYINSLATDAIPAHLPAPSLASIQIPLPPLSVQQEIVRILDKFTQLEAELEAELDCRKRQYEYYRNKLLSYEGNEVEWKTLGEVCKVLRGKRLTKRDLSASCKIPVFHGGIEPIGYYNESNRKANSSMLINVGASAGTVGFCNRDFWSSDGCFCFSHNNTISQRFLYYVLQTMETTIKSKVRKAGIPTLDNKEVERLRIPLPPLEEQQLIAFILDKFDTLVNSISEGLPKEIALRRKQYEYYREKLLSFPS